MVRPSSVVAVGPSLGANGGPRELSGLASGSLWAAGGLQMVPKEGPDSYLAWPRDLSGRSRTPKRAGQIAFLVRPSSVVDVGPSLGANGCPRELSGLASGSLWAAGGLQMVPKEEPDNSLGAPYASVDFLRRLHDRFEHFPYKKSCDRPDIAF